MKKNLVILVLTILFLLPTILAVEFDMKTEFSQGETLLARVSGNFLEPILRQNIFFYRGHVRIPIEYDVAKINDEFYIYALLDKPEENYTISIENIDYMAGKDITDEDIRMDFRVTNNTADFSITPGFIVTSDDFSVEVQNLQNEKINITIIDDYNVNSIELKSGEIEKLNFEIQDVSHPEFSILELSTENLKYEIPVYAFSTEKSEESLERGFKLEPGELKISMPTNSETKRILYLYNTGEATLENISFFISSELEEYLLFLIEDFEKLEPNSSVRIELFFSSPPEEDTIEGELTVKQEDMYTYTDIFLNFIQDYIPPEGENSEEIVVVSETCAERQGVICSQDQNCTGEIVYAKDDVFCCLGSCKEKTTSSTGKIIGWGLIIIIFLFLVWFFKKKYRGAKKQVNLFDIGRKK